MTSLVRRPPCAPRGQRPVTHGRGRKRRGPGGRRGRAGSNPVLTARRRAAPAVPLRAPGRPEVQVGGGGGLVPATPPPPRAVLLAGSRRFTPSRGLGAPPRRGVTRAHPEEPPPTPSRGTPRPPLLKADLVASPRRRQDPRTQAGVDGASQAPREGQPRGQLPPPSPAAPPCLRRPRPREAAKGKPSPAACDSDGHGAAPEGSPRCAPGRTACRTRAGDPRGVRIWAEPLPGTGARHGRDYSAFPAFGGVAGPLAAPRSPRV